MAQFAAAEQSPMALHLYVTPFSLMSRHPTFAVRGVESRPNEKAPGVRRAPLV